MRHPAHAALVTTALAMGGCAWSWWGDMPEPDDPGLYAVVDGDELLRLDGDSEYEQRTWGVRSNLEPDVEFVVYDPDLADESRDPADIIRLYQVSWVRSQISADGGVGPPGGNRWAASGLEGTIIPLQYGSGADDGTIAIRPEQPLEPGLYSLAVRSSTLESTARVGILWPEVDKQAYASATCVDSLVGEDGGSFFRPCSADVVGNGGSDPLRIYLNKPEAQTADGGRVLVIRGIVANDTSEEQSIPPLEGVLSNSDGAELMRWRFDAGVTELGPEQSVSFRTSVPNPPPDVRNVNVRLAPDASDSSYPSTAAD